MLSLAGLLTVLAAFALRPKFDALDQAQKTYAETTSAVRPRNDLIRMCLPRLFDWGRLLDGRLSNRRICRSILKNGAMLRVGKSLRVR